MFIIKNKFLGIIFMNLIIFSFFYSCNTHHENTNETWSSYLGDKSVSHYSSLHQIDTNNVQQLKLAWVYHTRDASSLIHSQIECNPNDTWENKNAWKYV